jgi:serine/threonine protein kinase
MSTPTPNSAETASPLDLVIAEYLQAVEGGLVPNRQALLEAHSDLTDDLHAFFADFDRMDRVASPLRMEVIDEATTDHSEGDAAPIRVRYFGDYELIEEIARGGMGIVYKARQVSLNRIVALKMVLKGALATPRDVARFRAEAEAVANLDHPNIIPIYEVGEHEGQQYFSMKFVEGGTLGRAPRLDARSEVSRLLTITRAVSFAHLRGILHRDLKPSNVLLDTDGTPYVTDFGLAKRLTDLDRSQTESGQFVGTPRYMAPEQAAARKDLTLAADVYSLGVILYERLSGRPPFLGHDLLSVLRHVRESPPPPLSATLTRVDRDLETIVRKCLEKLPGARYPTAEALAADLDRWHRGEPILARPVGQFGHAWRWCKRNPVVAGLSATVAASLLIGAIVSILFAGLASDRAARAKKAEGEAIAARDSTEQALAQSLVGPLYCKGEDFPEWEELSFPESMALWKIAGLEDDRVWLRFLDEATRDPVRTMQLRSRSEPALIAALRLDSSRRSRAVALFQKRVHDTSLTLPQRAEIALTALELEDRSGPLTEEFVKTLSLALTTDSPDDLRHGWIYYLYSKLDHLEPNTSASMLSEILLRETDANARLYLAHGLSSVALHLEPTESARMLTEALQRETDAVPRSSLAGVLSSVASRLEPSEAARVLTEALQRETVDYARYRLAEGLSSVASRLKPSEAMRVLSEALQRETDNHARGSLAEGLSSVAWRLEPSEAARVCSIAARVLSEALQRETSAYARRDLAEGLSSVAWRLEPSEAARVCGAAARVLSEDLQHNTDASHRQELAEGLSFVASRLEPSEAARVCGAAARVLSEDLQHNTDAHARQCQAQGLSSIASHLEPSEAAQVCGAAARVLSEDLQRETNANDGWRLAEGLSSVASRLEPSEAVRVCEEPITRLLHTLITEKHLRVSSYRSVALLLQHLDPRKARELARNLIPSLCAELGSSSWDDILNKLLADTSRPIPTRRTIHFSASTVGLGLGAPPMMAALNAAEPLPCRLTTQELVDLLKMPTCFGPARRVVLNHLEHIHHRRFLNHWAFVRFAEENHLDVDLKSPPRRPNHRESPERMHEVLGRTNAKR